MRLIPAVWYLYAAYTFACLALVFLVLAIGEHRRLRARVLLERLREIMPEHSHFYPCNDPDCCWPWCNACQSYHHPNNPTCTKLARTEEVNP